MYVVKKRTLIIVVALVVTAVTFVAIFGALAGGKASGTVGDSEIRIVLDAGHGGVDGGVSGFTSGVKEKELNLDVVKKLERHLVASGFSVILTRSTDAGLYGVATTNLKKRDMKKRSEIINSAKPVLVVSVHMNYYSVSTRRGAQVFYKSGDDNAKLLATKIQQNFNSMEEASRECSPLVGDYYLLNCSKYPSVIAECGFLSNPEDEKLLLTDAYREKIAYTLYKGIIEYLTSTTDSFMWER